MSYEASLTRLADQTDEQVQAAWRQYQQGQISERQFVQLASAIIAQADGQAASLADLSLSAEVLRHTGTPQPPQGIQPEPYTQARLEHGVETLLLAAAAGADITARLTRLATAEPAAAAAKAYSKGISKSKPVEGWYRGLSSNPCQLCSWWYRGGQVFPIDHGMPRHTGCRCVQIIVTRQKRSITS